MASASLHPRHRRHHLKRDTMKKAIDIPVFKPRPLIEDASKVISEKQIKVELTAKEKSFLDQYAK
ncbi:hypothetical protein LC55x_5638 [Lysobacter capsici]|nr:hypothetical protein LC55x_5638 [Lysobacter capsici]